MASSRHFLACCAAFACSLQAANNALVYVGTYTGAQSKGIYAWRFQASTGELTPLGVAAEVANPSFLAIHPNNKLLYAVSEVPKFEGTPGGAVSAYSIDPKTGHLTLLNRVSTRGGGPCFVTVDHKGKSVLIANYGGGSFAAYPLKDDGSLGEAGAFIQDSGSSANKRRQEGPHAHSINVSPDNRFAIGADLGIDKLLVWRFDADKATLTPNEPPSAAVKPGSGPRHFTFHPNGKFAYVINELANNVTAFTWDSKGGVLKEIQTVATLPKDFTGENTTAEVQVHPSGKFLYGSNRGNDSIAVFSIDTSKGTLTPVEVVPTEGQTPRNFRIDPTGQWLFAAHQKAGGVTVFHIDTKTGRLKSAGKKLDVWSPVCVKFVPVP